MTWHSFKTAICSQALSILDKENGILVSYSLAGNMHYTGEDGLPLWKKRRFSRRRQNSLFTMLKNLQLN
jgi:hypothetical protein